MNGIAPNIILPNVMAKSILQSDILPIVTAPTEHRCNIK
jgi:hypothetical protein